MMYIDNPGWKNDTHGTWWVVKYMSKQKQKALSLFGCVIPHRLDPSVQDSGTLH